MRINHNINALNTYARLSQANTMQGKSLEKLSSGLRINRAGDDAAGLAISEKMRSQIRGLDQASRNAQDGISMIQTAEGALSETHSILQRMRELAVQAGNDTNTTADRDEMQKEINQLSSEMNRIAGATEFNKKTLLDGTGGAGSVSGISSGITKQGTDATQAVYEYEFSKAVTAAATDCIYIKGTDIMGQCAAVVTCTTVSGSVKQLAGWINSHCSAWTAEASGGKLTLTAVAGCAQDGVTGNCTNILTFSCTSVCYQMESDWGSGACAQITEITFTDSGVKEGVVIASGNCSVGLWDSTSGTYANSTEATNALGVDTLVDISCSDGSVTCAKDLVTNLVSNASLDAHNVLCRVGDTTLKITADTSGTIGANEATVSVTAGSGSSAAEGGGTKLQIGANAEQTFTLSFSDMTGKGVNITSSLSADTITTSEGEVAYYTDTASVDDKDGTTNEFALDISTADKATAAISAIDDAIAAVSSERSKLGAYQNRLEHTIANLGTSAENLTAAESRIRDVDMAKEMMEFTKSNILNQAATAMLAQANQQPQGVLQLLR